MQVLNLSQKLIHNGRILSLVRREFINFQLSGSMMLKIRDTEGISYPERTVVKSTVPLLLHLPFQMQPLWS